MASWDGFLKGISAIPTAIKRAAGGGEFLSEEEREKEKVLYGTVQEALSKIPTPAKKLAGATGDLLLRVAAPINEKIISPYFRGISTVALLNDPESPLYKKGEYEEGFQFKDIETAWNRSQKVSQFQALTKSGLVPGLTPLSKMVLSTNNIDLDEVDLWNDESIEKNFVDNAVGRWFTGIGDFVVGTAALGGAGRAITIPVKFGATKAGLYTKTKTLDQLALDMESGVQYAKTNGATGSQTISGNHAVLLAESKDWGLITNLVSKYSTNDKLISLVHEASDADAVKDLLLADKGYLPALERLAKTAPDKLFDVSDTSSYLQAKFLQTGKNYNPDEASVPRLKAAYDAAIKNDPQFVKIRDAFFSPDNQLTPGGRAFMPLEPVIGKGLAITAGEKIRAVRGAVTARELDNFADIFETTVGKGAGRVAVSFVKFGNRVGLSARQIQYKPMGFVTFSGMRPLDGRVELNAFLNNIKLFRNGDDMIEISPDGTRAKVADLRRKWEDMYMRSRGGDEVKVMEEIDSEIGRYIAYKAKFYDEAEIKTQVAQFRQNINEGLDGFKRNGFGIGYDGRQIRTDDPDTIRQLVESFRFTPWDSIEGAFMDASKRSLTSRATSITSSLGEQVFRDLNRLWTFDVLVRPMYVVKQSIGEPLISATLSQGMSFLYNDMFFTGVRSFKNWGMWTIEKTVKIANTRQRAAVNKAVLEKQEQYARAAQIKDVAQASLQDLLSGNTSPGTKIQHLPAAREALKTASAFLDEVELDLLSAVKPFGKVEAIPSVTTLERRIGFLESKPNLGANAKEVKAAKQAIAKYRNTINKLTVNKKEIMKADDDVAKAYQNIDKVLDELGTAFKEQANVWGKSAKFKQRFYAAESQYRMLDNGEYVSIDSFTGTNAPFAAAIREEISNTRTSEINMLGEYSKGTIAGLIKRKVPSDIVRLSDPEYFEELAYIANRAFRQDPLMDLILGNTAMSDLKKWALSSEGTRYLRAFDITEKSQITPYLTDKVALVNRTFPSYEARAAILKREVTGQELQSLLANYTDELFDVVPGNFNYGSANLGGANAYRQLSDKIDTLTSAAYTLLAKPENPIRRAFFEKAATDVVARKASELAAQGVKITPNQLNAFRQAAGREALEELEKTFYTTRRQRRILYNARAAVAFPNASANAFYRYGRLLVNNPVRTTQFISNYGRAFQTFGVDENGNPTKDINEITHLIVPGTKDMGMGYMDQGIALNARSLGFMLNQFSPSWFGALSVGKIMQKFPGTEDNIRKIMDSTGAYSFDTVFPYGAPTSATKSFQPPWARSLWNAATGDQSRADYLSSWRSVYNYHNMLVEMGISETFPSDEMIEKEVRTLWSEKFLSSFISVFGVPYKVETNPMRGTANLFYKLKDKYVAQGFGEQDSRDLAGDEMIKLLGPKFMVDRVTFTGSTKEINPPATYEAYKRIFEDNDELVGKLASIDKDDIGMVNLLTADLPRIQDEKSTNILNLLSDPDLRLPGSSKRINDFRLTPKEVEVERMKQRTWNDYNMVRDALEAKITDGRTLRAHPELKVVLDRLVETQFKDQSQAWYDQYQVAASGDTSYKYARALKAITTDETFMTERKDSQFFKDARLFMKTRDIFANFYQSLPDYDPRKAIVRDNYNEWILTTAEQWDPNLETYIKQYFDNDSLKVVD
jgi:hypothetical protein